VKNLVACYKAYRGGEWFEASLESVIGNCSGAVVISTSEPWRGLPGTENRNTGNLPENCRAPLTRFRERHPTFPMAIVDVNGRHNSDTQYLVGLSVIKSLFGNEVGVLVIDTDEVWDSAALTSLREEMTNDRESHYFRSGIWSYIRSPLYRVHPQEKARVVVGLSSASVEIGDSRFSNIRGRKIKDLSISFHHMGYVRLDPEEIVLKLGNTASQDGVSARVGWKQKVWDHLPGGVNVHPAVMSEHCWSGVAEIDTSELPTAATDSDTFWGTLAHQRGGIPEKLLLGVNRGIDLPGNPVTTVRPEMFVPLYGILRRLGADATFDMCAFLISRLRMSFAETTQLALMSSRVHPGGKIVEIGSGMGGSMAVMGLATRGREIQLMAVDPYIPYDEDEHKGLEVGTPDDFCETMYAMKLDPSPMSLCSSEEAAKMYPDSTANLILVDGNHSYSHASQDLRMWWPKLTSGGFMLVHDVSTRFPGVVRAVKEFEEMMGVRFNLSMASSLAWVEKSR
jgi:hypothetical protein